MLNSSGLFRKTIATIALAANAPILLAEPSMTASRQLQMRVGESLVDSVQGASEVNLSRRGVVDVFVGEDGQITLTALRSGFVVVTLLSESVAKAKWLVQVEPPASPVVQRLRSLCTKLRLRCDEVTGVVEGRLQSAKHKSLIARLCRKGHCQDWTELGDHAMRSLVNQATALLGGAFEVEVLASGSLLVRGPCEVADRNATTKYVRELLAGLTDPKAVLLSCDGQGSAMYELEAWVVAEEEGREQSSGLGLQVGRRLDRFRSEPFEAHLVDEQSRGDKTILAHPQMRLVAGGEARFSSGGEFFSVERSAREEDISTWKRYGIDLVLKAQRESNNRAKLQFDLDVKDRFGGASRTDISQGSLKGESLVPLGESTFLGTMHVAADRRAQRGSLFLADVPILSPLSKVFSREESASTVALYVRLREESSHRIH